MILPVTFFLLSMKGVVFCFVFLSPYLVKIFTGVFTGEITWYLGFDLIYSRRKKQVCVGNMLTSSWLSLKAILHPSVPAPCPKSLPWRDCLSRNPLAFGFQLVSNRRPQQKGARKGERIAKLGLKVIASLKAACST